MTDPVIRDKFEATKVILMDHKPQTASLMNFLRQGLAEHTYLYNDSVILTRGHFAMVSSDCEEDLCILLQSVEHPEQYTTVFSAQEDWIEFLVDYFQCNEVETFYQFVALQKPEELPCDYEIRPIGPEYLEEVCSHYDRFAPGDEAYFAARLSVGASLGAFEGDKLIGFIFTHSEWSMGGLTIWPEYRHKGIAAALENRLIRLLFEKHDLRYCQCHIALNNKASLQLQCKLGLQLCDENVAWLDRSAPWVDPVALREDQEKCIPFSSKEKAEQHNHECSCGESHHHCHHD